MDDRFGLETAVNMCGLALPDFVQAYLLRYVTLLRSWQRAKNLISNDTLNEIWIRHIADGLQILPLLARWQNAELPGEVNHQRPLVGLDLGSGAGLPGMILALAGSGAGAAKDGGSAANQGNEADTSPDRSVLPVITMALVEANGRKASFLRTVSRETGVPVTVHNARIEQVSPLVFADDPSRPVDFITARALAPLDKLVGMADPWLQEGATAFFHKGGEYARELDEWAAASRYDVVEHESVVDSNSRILQIRKTIAETSRPVP